MNPNEENNLRKRMQEYASPINLDNEWEVLRTRLNKKKKRKRPFLFILISFGVFGASFLLYYSLQNSKIVSADKMISIDNENTILINSTSSENQETFIDSSHSKINHSKNNSAESFLYNNKHVNSENETSNELNNSNVKKTLGLVKQSNQNTEQHFLHNKAIASNPQAIMESSEQEISNYLTNQNNSVDSHLSSKVKIDIDNNSIPSMKQLGIQSIQPIPIRELSYKRSERISPINLPIILTDNSSNKKLFELYGGIGLLHSPQKFNAVLPKSEALSVLKQNTEQALETYYVDLGFRAYVNANIFLYAELSYLQGYDKLTYTEIESYNFILEKALTKVIAFKTNDPLEIYSDEKVIATRKTSYINYNKYVSYNGSVGLGKNIIRTKKLSLDISLGLGWNIRSNISGLTSDSQQGTIKVVNANQFYKKSFGLSTEAALHLRYPISNKLSIECRPIFRYYNKSITQADYGVESKLFRLGAIFGISHQLGVKKI